MKIIRYTSHEFIDLESEMHYAFLKLSDQQQPLQKHDFFELFFLLKGLVCLNVEGKEQLFQQGSLILIRPEEIHSKNYIGNCEYINIAFSKNTIYSLFHYLGEGFSKDLFLNCKFPPFVIVSDVEKNIIKSKMESIDLLSISNKQKQKMQLRILLLEILTRYFKTSYSDTADTIPLWIDELLSEMKKKENFTKGVTALIELSGKSHAHICRSFKKYFDLTPVEFVNTLKLNHAVNLLMSTNIDILTISFDSGFDTLSHFYHLFKKKYGKTPNSFRK